eukprot:gene16613-22856_t
MLKLNQTTVDILDYCAIGVTGVVFLISGLGLLATIVYERTPAYAASKDFNSIWRVRVCMQVLPLQVLWGPSSIIIEGGFHPEVFCRTFTAASFGLCEPLLMLLALFSCVFSLQGVATRHVVQHRRYNYNRALLSGQAWLLDTLFNTYDTTLTEYCSVDSATSPHSSQPLLSPAPAIGDDTTNLVPDSPPPNSDAVASNCIFCVFALFSTLASAGFAICYLLILLFVTQKLVAASINKAHVRRLLLLQLLVGLFLTLGLGCRAGSIAWRPFDLAYEVLRMGSVVSTAGLSLTLSTILVYKPLWDMASAERALLKMMAQQREVELLERRMKDAAAASFIDIKG